MTYNPARYENPYGIHLLDDLHNLFPEVLYDSEMFNGNRLVPFMQTRVRTLFSEEYSRNKGQYVLFQQARRRTEAGFSRPPQPSQPSQIPRPVPAEAAAAPRRSRTHFHTYTIPLFTGSANPVNENDDQDDTIQQTLETLITRAFGAAMEDVPVYPTRQQIASASIVSSIEPPVDVTCAICQDHEQPTETSQEWRILRHCSHRFHRTCIDQWFRQNVHCPVCRHDIRESAH